MKLSYEAQGFVDEDDAELRSLIDQRKVPAGCLSGGMQFRLSLGRECDLGPDNGEAAGTSIAFHSRVVSSHGGILTD